MNTDAARLEETAKHNSAEKINVATGTRLEDNAKQDLAVTTLELTLTKLIEAELIKEPMTEAKVITELVDKANLKNNMVPWDYADTDAKPRSTTKHKAKQKTKAD